jgi:hypothetical protein
LEKKIAKEMVCRLRHANVLTETVVIALENFLNPLLPRQFGGTTWLLQQVGGDVPTGHEQDDQIYDVHREAVVSSVKIVEILFANSSSVLKLTENGGRSSVLKLQFWCSFEN